MGNTQVGKHAQSAKKGLARPGKIALIAIGIIVAAAVVLYFAGVAVFSRFFMPGSYVSDVDISWSDASQVAQKLDDAVANYTFNIKGQGLDLEVSAAQAGLTIDSLAAADSMLAAQNAWAWPAEVFAKRDDSAALTSALSATGLADVINSAVEERNKTATAPTNATIKYDSAAAKFVVVPEAPGTCLDASKVLNTVLTGALALESTIRITTDDLATPSITSTTPTLLAALDKANDDIAKTITLTYNGAAVAAADKATIASWITLGSDLSVNIDTAAVTAWVTDVASKYNTVGATRVYTRPDGKTVTVSGGDYGWQINTDTLVAQVLAAIDEGGATTIELPVLQAADALPTSGNRDFGARFIDVDLTEQHARFYDASGNIIWEADIVSGVGNSSYATPQGTWSLNNKQSPSTLIGNMTSSGTPEYETVVSYWLPFEGNMVGFHDATWQSAFGGTRYLQGYGSHGCINLSLSDAAALYDIIQIGDVVVVHE